MLKFENATEFLQDARSIKGPEEIAWIERAAEILDKVVAAILAKARPGVMENDMVATIWQTIIANGGDYPSMTHWGAGAGVPWACRIAPHRPLQAGDMINTELEAKYGGYISQTVQAACLGKIPTELKRAFDVSVKVFNELVKFMKPGVSYRAVIEFYQKLVREAGFIPKGHAAARPRHRRRPAANHRRSRRRHVHQRDLHPTSRSAVGRRQRFCAQTRRHAR